MSAQMATVLAQTTTKSEDGLRIYELSQKKKISSEARRISNILENCISRVKIAAALPAVLQLNSVSTAVSEELSRGLQEHQILAERLETLEGLKQESDGEQNGEARMRAKTDIKNSARHLLRVVQAHPDDVGGLREELGVEVGESEYRLIRGLEKFHGHVVERLLTSLDEESQPHQKQMSDAFLAHDLEFVASLEEKVAADIKQIDAEIAEQNVKIDTLQTSPKGNSRLEEGMSVLADKQCQSHIKASKMKHASLQQEIDRLSSQLNTLVLENMQSERDFREKNENVKTEIEYLLQTFDDEMNEFQANLELNSIEYEREEEERRKLGKPFSVLELEYNQILEKHCLAEEKRREELKELELKTKAAIVVQAWWRGYSTRKALKNKGKSKKAKKQKGKKGK